MRNDDPLFQMLLSLKDRPALRLGKKSLLALEALVHGYLDACHDFRQGASTISWFREFDSFVVAACVGEKMTCNAFSAILCCGYDDESGVDYFIACLERFAKERGEAPVVKTASSALKDGEVRQACIDKQKAAEVIAAYVREHCQELFQVSSIGGRDTLLLSWDRNNDVSCYLTNSSSAIAQIYKDEVSYSEETCHGASIKPQGE